MQEYIRGLKDNFLTEAEVKQLDEALRVIAIYGMIPALEVEKELPNRKLQFIGNIH